MTLRKVQKVQKNQQKRQLKNRCTFYYNHLDINEKQDKKTKQDKKEEEDNNNIDKDYYKQICKKHTEKKGKKKYWSNVSRYGNSDDLI